MISGIIKTPLKQFQDNRGKVMHMLRVQDPCFKKFGEIYFSWVYFGVVKAWKLHKEMTMNFAVPVGNIKLVLYDGRNNSATFGKVNEFYMGVDDYYLLTIPNNIWYGFTAVRNEQAMIANCTTLPHSPSEAAVKDISDTSIPYLWRLENE